MTDDERRAEIEAVARAWWAHDPTAFDRLTPEWRALQMRRAEAAVEVLDRVRDARGDDEADRLANDLAGDWRDCLPMRPLRSPQDEDHDPADDEYGECGVLNPGWQKGVLARSPQDEGHEET